MSAAPGSGAKRRPASRPSRKGALSMKLLFLLFAFAPLASVCAQQSPAGPPSMPPSEDSRIRVLEDQVHTLTEEVALLRAEMQSLRPANEPVSGHADQMLLASSH